MVGRAINLSVQALTAIHKAVVVQPGFWTQVEIKGPDNEPSLLGQPTIFGPNLIAASYDLASEILMMIGTKKGSTNPQTDRTAV